MDYFSSQACPNISSRHAWPRMTGGQGKALSRLRRQRAIEGEALDMSWEPGYRGFPPVTSKTSANFAALSGPSFLVHSAPLLCCAWQAEWKPVPPLLEPADIARYRSRGLPLGSRKRGHIDLPEKTLMLGMMEDLEVSSVSSWLETNLLGQRERTPRSWAAVCSSAVVSSLLWLKWGIRVYRQLGWVAGKARSPT